MSVIQRSSWTCRLCNVSLDSIHALYSHFMSKDHRTELPPLLRAGVGMLQCFLDTYFSEEPILGLEYVEEQSQVQNLGYPYTCKLCNKRGNWQVMFQHVVSIKHLHLFIGRYEPRQMPRLRDFSCQKYFNQAVIAVGRKIHKTLGRQSIRQRKEMPDGDGKNGNSASVKRPTSEEFEEQNPSKRKKVMDSEIVAKHPGESGEILQYLQKFTNRDHFCSLCSMSCPTTMELYRHITGFVHAVKLERLAPEKVKESTRLCNFLDTYMKGEPILGLGFIAEKEANTMYMYTCLLCDAQENWPHIFTHLLTVDHMARYMDRYHNELVSKPKNFCNREAFVKAITESAIRLYKNLGDVSVPVAASEDDGEEENPSPLAINVVQNKLHNKLPCPVEEIPLDFPEAELEREQELEALGVSSAQKPFCRVCQLSFSNALELCKHLMTASHRRMLGDAPPEVLQRLSSLKYYLDTLLKDEPFVGLEYLVENKRGSSWLYNCLLCNMNNIGQSMLLHICGGKHIAQYIMEHHRDDGKFPIDVSKKVLKKYAVHICKLYGRKEMKPVIKDTCSPEESKVDDLLSKYNGDSAVPVRKVVREVNSGFTGNCQTLK